MINCLCPRPLSPAVFIIRQNKPWSSCVILPGVRRCRSYRAGNKQNSSYNDVILSSSHKQPSVRWAQKHDNLFPAFNCTLSRVIQHSESQHNKQQQYSDFLTGRGLATLSCLATSWPDPGCSQYSRNNSNYTLLPRPLSVVWKVLTSGCHHVATSMSCHHVVTSPVSRVGSHTSQHTCLCYFFWATKKIENNKNIFFNNAPLKDSLWMINNAKLKVKQNNIIPELNPSLANIN